MPSTLPSLLCLGLYLSLRAGAQNQTLSKPLIWAKPSFMVPNGASVFVWCQGTHRAIEYQLHFKGLFTLERPNDPGLTNKVKFSIQPMTSSTAGQYTCFYRTGELWSEPSDPLDLVITGMYDRPTLSVHPGPEVLPGENVTFSCHLETATTTFFLHKEGTASRPWRRVGNSPAAFSMGPVTPAHRGTYRCFGSYNEHMWSFPSEPVTLLVTGDAGVADLASTGQPSSPDSWELHLSTTKKGLRKDLIPWDYTAENLFRVGLGLLVLVALMCLLAHTRLLRKKTKRASSQERRRRYRWQGALDE
ncbi:natural cytotoxicity triggering receptor 1-like isoform X1 [Myotis myotis]|uniref:Natural cytotoxicity triggering receptor 1 n=1 Tax=Myotis myotis TaxID=51298 RepID=A0A7J7R0M7_MYOMY|nr:natural cytotoxicity triggering receptor 1-like isoform X1 [Myotis myotis]KAF6269547.1 natural cytotoxicity triggering receptor 1 [Myotis myotis]